MERRRDGEGKREESGANGGLVRLLAGSIAPFSFLSFSLSLVLSISLSLSLSLGLTAARAEDVVILTGKDGGRLRTGGQIVDFTGQALILRHPSGREEKIDPKRLVEVKTEFGPRHTEGDARFEEGKFALALESYRLAVAEEHRVWVRRKILARCVWCYQNLGQIERAVEAFLAIYRGDPTTQYFDAIPLAWTTVQPSPLLGQRTKEWLADERLPVSRLIAASWLIPTADRASALKVLRGLINDPDPRVVFLAEAQLWRAQVATATLQDAHRWQDRVQQMPESIRAGPYYVAGLALARHERHEEAALALMRAPILYPLQRGLAATSLLAAAAELERMNQSEMAAGLYRELVVQHPQSTAEEEAQRRLQALTGRRAE